MCNHGYDVYLSSMNCMEGSTERSDVAFFSNQLLPKWILQGNKENLYTLFPCHIPEIRNTAEDFW